MRPKVAFILDRVSDLFKDYKPPHNVDVCLFVANPIWLEWRPKFAVFHLADLHGYDGYCLSNDFKLLQLAKDVTLSRHFGLIDNDCKWATLESPNYNYLKNFYKSDDVEVLTAVPEIATLVQKVWARKCVQYNEIPDLVEICSRKQQS
jgi:hypothetical protein